MKNLWIRPAANDRWNIGVAGSDRPRTTHLSRREATLCAQFALLATGGGHLTVFGPDGEVTEELELVTNNTAKRP